MDRLTLDSIAAQKAGMSYGKWKALQAQNKVEAAPVTEVPEKVCMVCGKAIPIRGSGSGREKTHTCSPGCAEERHRRRMAANYHKRKERMMADGKI